MTVYSAALLTAAAAAALCAAPTHLPLNTGNEWTYREGATGQTMQIRVGLGLMHSGNVYFKVTGYTPAPMYLRNDENGDVYYLDEEKGQEFLLTSFEAVEHAWYDTRIGGCEQGYQPQQKPVEYRGAHSYLPAALEMIYRTYSCADAGISHELYVANVGLVQRTTTTIAGPRTWDLVHARVGPLVFAGEPNTSFRVSLDRTRVEPSPGESPAVRATLRLSVHHSPAAALRFASAQRYDLQVRNAAGEVVWRWSDGVFFPQVVEDVNVWGDLVYTESIPATSLAPGQYTVEAWLNTVGREFACATAFEVLPEDR